MVNKKPSSFPNRSGRDRRRLWDAYILTEDVKGIPCAKKDEKVILFVDEKEKRSQPERRKGWRRVSKWGSVCEEKNKEGL